MTSFFVKKSKKDHSNTRQRDNKSPIFYNKNDNREIQLESGEWMQTLFNKYEEMEFSNYNINTKYYLQAIEKEIENIEPRQMMQLAIDYFK